MPAVIHGAAQMRAWSDERRARGRRVVLVPTMGALHAGHLSLVDEARRHGDEVVVSIFVNPTQFGPGEDLDRYPRDLQGDLAKLAGADAVFVPTPADVYPDGFDTFVVPEALASVLCGRSRPGHFRGVCTVVTILFRLTRCHAAVFGEKDYQQLQIVRRMARDLWLDVEIVGAPIVREADGLAMSSRNAYLSPAERQQALALPGALAAVRRSFEAGERSAQALRAVGRDALGPDLRLEYLEVVDAESLQAVAEVRRPAVCAAAVHAGATRLIDNVRLTP